MSDRMVARFRELDNPEFDVLHFHDWHVVDAMHALTDRNTVMTFHSTEYGRAGNRIGDWWEAKDIMGKEWYGAYIAKRVTAVSHALKDEIMWLYDVPFDKVDVVPNGISPGVYEAAIDPCQVKKSYGIHPFSPLVLFVGRMEYQKGPDLFVDAIPQILLQHPGAQFVMAGAGTMQLGLQARCAGLPVQFPGYVTDYEYVRLLNACDVVVIPSRNEPFGLVLLEAWSVRKCPVVSDVGGLSENVSNFNDGVKVDPDPASIARGINYVLRDPSRAAALGRNGHSKAKLHFSWDRIANRMMSVYRNRSR